MVADFHGRLAKALYETFAIFGDVGRDTLLAHIEKNCSANIEEIAGKPEVFHAHLERLIGESASVVESIAIQKMNSMTGLTELGGRPAEFVKYVRELSRSSGVR